MLNLSGVAHRGALRIMVHKRVCMMVEEVRAGRLRRVGGWGRVTGRTWASKIDVTLL